MALIAGVNIPDNMGVEYSLRQIYGIGATTAKKIVSTAGVDGNPKVKDLDNEELSRIRELVEKEHKVEGDLRREINSNIRRLIDIGSYRGLRHQRALPLRGQRTKTNARTKRGSRKTVAGRRHSVARK